MKPQKTGQIEKFAETLVERGAQVKKGDKVYLLAKSLESLPLFEEVRRKIIEKGGLPHEHLLYDSQIGSEGMDYEWMKKASKEQLETVSKAKEKEIEEMDAYIRIGGPRNSQELSSIDPEKISKRKKATEELLDKRLDTKWAATRYPTSSMAQTAGMPTQEMKQMVYKAVNETDWESLKKKNEEVKQVFDNADKIQIKGKETDLTLSLKNRKGINAHGKNNIPDGEVFYAPITDSVEGKIKFTYPGIVQGNKVEGIELEFEKGEITSFSAEKNQELLKEMIETDKGAKRIGELGIGTNRQITNYVGDTLFDEKIGGTIHLALGRAYGKCVPEKTTPNKSGIHWDIVKDLRPRAGGGKIKVDGQTVQKDGEWVF